MKPSAKVLAAAMARIRPLLATAGDDELRSYVNILIDIGATRAHAMELMESAVMSLKRQTPRPRHSVFRQTTVARMACVNE